MLVARVAAEMRYTNPDCYAGPLGDCSRKLSREHFISKDVLERLGATVRVSGVPWLPAGSSRPIPITKLKSWVLCVDHNSGLSPLDAAAGKLFDLFTRFDHELSSSEDFPTHEDVRVDGLAFERWLYKVYCGLHFGGHLGAGGVRLSSPALPDYVLVALFRSEPVPPDYGLYFGGQLGTQMSGRKQVAFGPMTHPETGAVQGLLADFHGLTFVCSIRPGRSGGTGRMDNLQRHPAGIELRSGGRVRAITFQW
jgi:hypothetical protein